MRDDWMAWMRRFEPPMGLVGVLESFVEEVRNDSPVRVIAYVKAGTSGSLPVPIARLASTSSGRPSRTP
jgi:hypothetical protein